MSDQETPRNHFSVRLNEVAMRQLQELADTMNIPKSNVISQAIAKMHREHFPPKDPPPPPRASSAS